MNLESVSLSIKEYAHSLGFQYCGISQAVFLEQEAPHLEKWLKTHKNAEMAYMEKYFDLRLNPKLLVEGAESVISVLLNYYPKQSQHKDNNAKIAKYAWGKDYHYVIKDKLHLLFDYIKTLLPDVQGRAFVDSAPVMDKVWAKRSGLGWIGKHSNLIVPKAGSFFLIGELIITEKLMYDAPIQDLCGTCTKCINACPTQAILEPYVVDANRCISYLTIELKNEIPDEFQNQMDGWIFGCDVCQDVCPWNIKFSTPTDEPYFTPLPEVSEYQLKDWLLLDEKTFKKIFKQSAISRPKYKGMMRNARFLLKNQKPLSDESFS
ncbi:MAG: tRNA epoxyqueuosine(34) reductase QueG [Bacteroidia bacterium]|nr:tRNA epoxyqueuosine(34) reductase QueG [Bacteroidia bacterium]MDW8347192.1 tRNA epoxyqueuosine(34) reductase QueG [Bacteroidia bacterium]